MTFWSRTSSSLIAKSIPFFCSSSSSSARTGRTSFEMKHAILLEGRAPSRPFAKKDDTEVVPPSSRKLMKRILLTVLFSIALAIPAHAKLNVVATLPDLGSLAREIGGDNVSVTVLAKPTEDPHFVDARPSFVVALRSADVLIDGGAELELGWLPPLLQNARNPKIEIGKPGRVQASQGVRLMNVPTNVTRAAGAGPALGNPHFGVDQIFAKPIRQPIAQPFSQSTQPTPLPTTRT